MGNIKVSIVTVSLNCVKTIKQTIKSVLDQTYDDIEYIIVDGGSTDGTLEYVRQSEPLFNGKMRYVSEKDKGLYDAMNKGVKMSQGDVIAFINGDDWYEINAVSDIVDFFDDPEVAVVCGTVNAIKDEKVKEVWKGDIKEILYRMPCCHQGIFARKKLFYEIGMFDLEYSICADYDWLLRVYSSGAHIVCTQNILANFRMGGLGYKKRNCTIAEQLKVANSNAERTGLIELLPEISEKLKSAYGDELYWLACIHDLNQIKGLLGEKCTVSLYIWGTGTYGHECMDLFQMLGLDVKNFIDNHITKDYMGGYQVISPERMDEETMICIATIKYEDEIIQQLQDMDIPTKRYFCFSKLKEKIITYEWEKTVAMLS